MARNGSGTYSKVNTFTAGTTITASGHNQNWDDLVSEMTNSVAADGQTSMTGPLKLSSGTVSAPGLVFSSDTDTGIYRIGSNNIGVAVGGSKILDLVSTACNVVGTIKQNGFAIIPVGLGPLPWSGMSAPSGWVLANGQSLLRASYPDLWTFAQTEIAGGNLLYTNGNGSTTFTVADMTGRTPAGAEASATRLTSTYFGGDSTILGTAGGGESHTLTRGELPTGITSTVSVTSTINTIQQSASSGNITPAGSTLMAQYSIGSVTSTGTATSNNTSGNAHAIVQPTLITNFIIFAGV